MKNQNCSFFKTGAGTVSVLIVSIVAFYFLGFHLLSKKFTLHSLPQATLTHCSDEISNSDKPQKVPFYESLSVLLVTKRPVFIGCVNRNDTRIQNFITTTQLKFDPIDCALFCVGRNYSRMNIRTNDKQSTCFCSEDLQNMYSICENSDNIFKSYTLDPVTIPSVKVKHNVSKIVSPSPLIFQNST